MYFTAMCLSVPADSQLHHQQTETLSPHSLIPKPGPYIYEIECVRVCMCLCSLCMATVLSDLHEIWHVASLYPTEIHES